MGHSRMDSLADDIRKAREALAALERPGRTVPADRAKKIKTARKRLDNLLARANESVASLTACGRGACGVKKASGAMSGADMITTLLATRAAWRRAIGGSCQKETKGPGRENGGHRRAGRGRNGNRHVSMTTKKPRF